MANSNFFDEAAIEKYNNISEDYVLSVTQINEYVESLLSCDKLLRNVSIEGEISGFKRYYSSGHCYFSLKDTASSIKCVMFKGNCNGLTFSPEDGMRVIITGYVSLYVRDGSYQFYVKSMRSVGEGELYRRFCELKTRLEAEGLFASEHKKKLPTLPRAVGVVTSRSGAVLHDIISVTKRRYPQMNIVLCHCSVQGVDAPREIAAAIKKMDKSRIADVIIVGRGGGSIEDLWCFNDETVARAIYDCETPIVSAVGHETDFSIADFAADMRAPTPSAAAELVVPLYNELCERLNNCLASAYELIRNDIGRRKQNLQLIQNSFESPENHISFQRNRLEMMQLKAAQAIKSSMDIANQRIEGYYDLIRSLSPKNVLKRGYAIVSDASGAMIKNANDLKAIKDANIQFVDGSVAVEVKVND